MSEFSADTVPRLLQQGVALQQSGRMAEAEALYRDILRAHPALFDALHLLGLLCAQQGRMADAADFLGQAVGVNGKVAPVLTNWGVALRALGRADEALAAYDRALVLDPRDASTYYNRANALKDLLRYDEALAAFGGALERNPRHSNAFYNRGVVLQTLGRSTEALADFDAALRLNPRHVEAYYNRGASLRELRRFAEALGSYEHAIALKPDHGDAYLNRGNTLKDLGRFADAVASYDRAIAFKPGDIGVIYNRALVLRQLNRFVPARDGFAQVLALDPSHAEAAAQQFLLAGEICDWDMRVAMREKLGALIRAGAAVPPFAVLAALDDSEMQSRAAVQYSAQRFAPRQSRGAKARPKKGGRLRIGYVSADYRTHPTAFLLIDLLERHDRSRFELVGLSLAPSDGSPMRTRCEKAFDRFIDVTAMSDDQAAEVIAREDIAIAVDLGAYTQHARPGILVTRPAPLAVNYLGFPGTMGAPHIDYILADAHVIPESNRRHFTESIAYLPGSYQPPDATRVAAATVPSRAEMGLPEQAFVFCCFNNSYKFTPELFDVWMRCLQAVPASVLWMFANNDLARAHLRAQAQARGIDQARLVFAGHIPHDAHLARLPLADLFLDTAPYNAHTTASDALWAGVPVITCSGESFPARVAGSLLRAVELPQLEAASLPEYEQMALALANHPAKLRSLRDHLLSGRDRLPLFDGENFRRHVEAAYGIMWERALSGLPPETFTVSGADG